MTWLQSYLNCKFKEKNFNLKLNTQELEKNELLYLLSTWYLEFKID